MTPSHFLKNKKEKSIINLNDLKFDTPVLFHASDFEHAASNLQLGHMKARTQQRYWEDGRTYKDNHPKYKSSGWMYGWSMTRERNFAGDWSDMVFIFDRNKVQSQYKVKPLSWSYRVANGSGYYKKEREDFVIAGKDPRSTDSIIKEYRCHLDKCDLDNVNEYKDELDFQSKTTPDKIINLNNKTLKGFLVSDFIIDLYGETDPNIQYLLNHKLCIGKYSRENAKLHCSKQKNPSNPYSI